MESRQRTEAKIPCKSKRKRREAQSVSDCFSCLRLMWLSSVLVAYTLEIYLIKVREQGVAIVVDSLYTITYNSLAANG